MEFNFDTPAAGATQVHAGYPFTGPADNPTQVVETIQLTGDGDGADVAVTGHPGG